MMRKLARSLDKIVDSTAYLKQVHRTDLQFGDVLLISTRNSLYSLRVMEDNHYLVSGGWFDREYGAPLKTTIIGCTWGGSVIKVDVIAACGLCLEFGNRVITSTIQKIVVIKHGQMN